MDNSFRALFINLITFRKALRLSIEIADLLKGFIFDQSGLTSITQILINFRNLKRNSYWMSYWNIPLISILNPTNSQHNDEYHNDPCLQSAIRWPQRPELDAVNDPSCFYRLQNPTIKLLNSLLTFSPFLPNLTWLSFVITNRWLSRSHILSVTPHSVKPSLMLYRQRLPRLKMFPEADSVNICDLCVSTTTILQYA